MSLLNSLPSCRIFSLIISTTLVASSSLLPQHLAWSHPEGKISLRFPVEDVGQPENGSVGGGVRGGEDGPSFCFKDAQKPMTALIPIYSHVGITTSAHPTFFVYVPQIQPQEARFVVYDELGNQLYLTEVALTGTPGIIQLKLPETISLENEQDYLWQFIISCTPENPRLQEMVWGIIRRTQLSPTAKRKLERLQFQQQATLLKQAQVYAEAKVWHDTLTILAQLRNSRPQEWEELLKSVGLDQMAQEPFVESRTR